MEDPTVELWALDEVHFQQHGSRCRMWVPPEVRDPVSLHHPTRKQVGYFGAVRLSDGRFHYQRESDSFNARTCWTFLKSLRRVCKNTKKRVIVIADNAKFHHALLHKPWREKMAPRFALDFLPPYSPELNPIERVWKLTRRNCLHNRYFSQLSDLIEDVENQFNQWHHRNATLHRLCAKI
jgi:transposase